MPRHRRGAERKEGRARARAMLAPREKIPWQNCASKVGTDPEILGFAD